MVTFGWLIKLSTTISSAPRFESLDISINQVHPCLWRFHTNIIHGQLYHHNAVQFHTGLGDNDITVTRSSPSHLQPIIKAYPNTTFILLHASYPFTREAAYLTSVYKNVYLDFGEIFPILSGDGQRETIRQVLELCPTNKMMWSSEYSAFHVMASSPVIPCC